MTTIDQTCSCGALVAASVSQGVHADSLRWSSSYHCAQCGSQIEADDIGPAPEHVRRALIAAEGLYALAPAFTDRAQVVRAVAIVRRELDLDARSAAALIREGLQELHGTHAEMAWLAHALATAGLSASVSKLS